MLRGLKRHPSSTTDLHCALPTAATVAGTTPSGLRGRVEDEREATGACRRCAQIDVEREARMHILDEHLVAIDVGGEGLTEEGRGARERSRAGGAKVGGGIRALGNLGDDDTRVPARDLHGHVARDENGRIEIGRERARDAAEELVANRVNGVDGACDGHIADGEPRNANTRGKIRIVKRTENSRSLV